MKRRRGRPPGIDPRREAALARLIREGLSLGQIAARLGVTRQCIHAQLRKCPQLEALRRQARALRLQRQAAIQQERFGWEAILSRGRSGKEMVKFLLEARNRGWEVVVRARRRPVVQGVPVSIHCPKRARPASKGPKSTAAYYHVRVTRTDWLHVVCLPSGAYRIWLPGTLSRAGSVYVPVTEASNPTEWPTWHAPSITAARAA